MAYESFFLSCGALWFLCAISYEIIFDFLGGFMNIRAAKVHEGKGDAYINSAMFLSIEDDY